MAKLWDCTSLCLALLGASGPLIGNLYMADVGGCRWGHALGGPIADAMSGIVSLVAALVSVASRRAGWRRRLRDLRLA